MDNAKKFACDILVNPTDEKFAEKRRLFQGCPTLAVTPKGRIYAGWYSGGTCEPHMGNYNLLVYSDDGGESWSMPVLVIPSDKQRLIHALDIQLWTAPDGALHVYWVQNNVKVAPEILPQAKKDQPLVAVEGYLFDDFVHACWEIVCRNPDDVTPVFTQPRYLDKGFLRCKPLVMADGTYLNFNYDQTSPDYGYSISADKGETYVHRYGAKKLTTMFDESMAYTLQNGAVRMLARSSLGFLAESYSYDNGRTWSEARLSDIPNPDTRFYVSRTPSGRVLLVNNDDGRTRTNMSAWLSDDDGKTWAHKCCLDDRDDISYPDADFYGGEIYLIYDRERCGAREILFARFTEDDIVRGADIRPRVISKP